MIPNSTPHWATSWRQNLIDQYGTPEQNPHHAKDDSHVPFNFSEKLNSQLQEANKLVEFYPYEGNDHNLTNSFDTAMVHSVEFFDRYLKLRIINSNVKVSGDLYG